MADRAPGAEQAPPRAPAVVAPLEGVRVLEVSRFLAGPYAGWILAELGADVVKVEDSERPDEARSVGPYFAGDLSLYFAALNGGKRSLALRLRSPEGRALFLELARDADVVLDNHKPGTMDRLGLGPDVLHEANPALVTCSLSGFGATGALRERAGYDYTIQALAGVMSMTGEPGGPPGKAGISYVDHSGGLGAALAVSAALAGRARTGVGGHLDLGLFDIQVSMLSYLAAWQLNTGYPGERTADAAHPSLVPAQNFATSDGHISVFVGNDAMWRRLTEALADPWLADPRFASIRARQEAREEIVSRLAAVFAGAGRDHWVNLLERFGVPCAPVNDLGQALAEQQVADRGLVATAGGAPGGGKEGAQEGRSSGGERPAYRHVRGPFPLAARPHPRPAPALGEHSAELLREAGVDAGRVEELLRGGVVVQQPGSPAVPAVRVPGR